MTTRLTLKQVGGSTKGRGKTLQTTTSSSPNWDRTHWKTSSWHSQHSSRSEDLWILVRGTSFGWLENLQTADRRCEQYTHKDSTYRVAQRDHIFITRTCVAQELQSSGLHIFVSLNNCHQRVMSHSLPHSTLNHKHKFSLTYLTYLTYLSVNITNTHKTLDTRSIIYPAKFHGIVADQHKSHFSQVIETEPRK